VSEATGTDIEAMGIERGDGDWTGTAPPGSSAAWPAAPESPKHIGPHTLRHAFITAALDAGVPA
jgi:integrase